MSEILPGQYFLWNGETLPHERRLLRESHDKFSFMFYAFFTAY